jgi:CheY-like chemotaxis protein
VSELQTITEDSTSRPAAAAIALPLVLVADPDPDSRARRADQLRERGFRVALARTSFEAIVKASCQLPDLILIDAALASDGTAETTLLLSTCPATAHIPIVRLTRGKRLPARVTTRSRRSTS